MEEEARQGLGKPAKGAATPTQLAPGGRGPRMARAARLLKRTLCVRARVGGHLCPTLCDPVNCIARQAPLSTGFCRQEYWSGLPCPPPENLPHPGEGNGTPFQYSCLENPRDGGAWWAAVYGVAQSRTRLKRLSSSRD